MPRLPVLNREVFFTKHRRENTYRMLDFALVNTSIGALVESRPLALYGVSKITDTDPFDLVAFDKISEMSEDEFYKLHGTGGLQVTLNFQA